MKINENSTKDVCLQMFETDESAYCDFTKSPFFIEKLKTDPTLNYATNVESI
ncbi:1969_t:CDS:2, partial [Scutellospora calospora]